MFLGVLSVATVIHIEKEKNKMTDGSGVGEEKKVGGHELIQRWTMWVLLPYFFPSFSLFL